MAGNLTNAEENRLLDSSLSSAKVGLFTSDPGEAGGGTEVTGGSYARQNLGAAAAAGGASSNAADIVFPQASADWGTVSHLAIFDSTGATMRWYGPAATAKQVLNGDQAIIGAGTLTFLMD